LAPDKTLRTDCTQMYEPHFSCFRSEQSRSESYPRHNFELYLSVSRLCLCDYGIEDRYMSCRVSAHVMRTFAFVCDRKPYMSKPPHSQSVCFPMQRLTNILRQRNHLLLLQSASDQLYAHVRAVVDLRVIWVVVSSIVPATTRNEFVRKGR
jgi:hypothetical protein